MHSFIQASSEKYLIDHLHGVCTNLYNQFVKTIELITNSVYAVFF